MAYLVSIHSVDFMNNHVSLLFHVTMDGRQLSILDSMCLQHLCICLFRCSTFSLFCLMFLRLWLGDCVAMGTKTKLLLLLYGLASYTLALPCLSPILLLSHHCYLMPTHTHHALIHKLILDDLAISSQHYDGPWYHAPILMNLLTPYIEAHMWMLMMKLFENALLLFVTMFLFQYHIFEFFHCWGRRKGMSLEDGSLENIHNSHFIEHITLLFIAVSKDKPFTQVRLRALPWNSSQASLNNSHL